MPGGIIFQNVVKRIYYEIYRSVNNGSFSKVQTLYIKNNMTGAKTIKVKGAAKVSANVTKLVKNKRYYVSVRCYKTVGKVTYYSTWSAAKNTVVKK